MYLSRGLMFGITLSLAACGTLAGGPLAFQSTLLEVPGGAVDTDFGQSMAIGSGLALVGSTTAASTGLVYCYDSTDGSFVGTLTPFAPGFAPAFGSSVDISGNFALVGARLDSGAVTRSGRAHLYNLASLSHVRTLDPSDGTVLGNFGTSVTLNSFAMFAGFPNKVNNNGTAGAVYAYLLGTVTDNEVAQLIPDQGSGDVRFGFAVDCTEDLLVVGAPGNTTDAPSFGAAYVYAVVSGARVHRLQPDSPALGNDFGRSIAIDDALVAVGAPRDGGSSASNGAVYVFHAFTGEQLARLSPAGSIPGGRFGASVAIADGRIVVSALRDNDGATSAGAVYVYNAATFTLIEKLVPDGLLPFQGLGTSVAAGNDIIGAGGPGVSTAPDPGLAFLFAEGCIADFNGDGAANVLDVVAFKAA